MLDFLFRNTKEKKNGLDTTSGRARITEVYLDPGLRKGEASLSAILCKHLHIKKGKEVFVHNKETEKEIKARVKKPPMELLEGEDKSESGFFITLGQEDISELELSKSVARKTGTFKDMYSEVYVRRK